MQFYGWQYLLPSQSSTRLQNDKDHREGDLRDYPDGPNLCREPLRSRRRAHDGVLVVHDHVRVRRYCNALSGFLLGSFRSEAFARIAAIRAVESPAVLAVASFPLLRLIASTIA